MLTSMNTHAYQVFVLSSGKIQFWFCSIVAIATKVMKYLIFPHTQDTLYDLAGPQQPFPPQGLGSAITKES